MKEPLQSGISHGVKLTQVAGGLQTNFRCRRKQTALSGFSVPHRFNADALFIFCVYIWSFQRDGGDNRVSGETLHATYMQHNLYAPLDTLALF